MKDNQLKKLRIRWSAAALVAIFALVGGLTVGCESDSGDDTEGAENASTGESTEGEGDESSPGEGGEGEGEEGEDGTEGEEGEGSECEPFTAEPGTSLGDLFDMSLTVTDCSGEPVTLSDETCGNKLTLIDIGAGWCIPCIEGSEIIEEKYVEPFGDQGFEVVSILIEDADSNPASSQFCGTWRDEFELTGPVLYDPIIQVGPYFEAAQQALPIYILVNQVGEIVFFEAGNVPADLDTIIGNELAKQE